MEMAIKTMEMVVESMEMAPGALPHPGRVPKQRFLSLEIGLRWRRHCGTFLGETPIHLGFSCQRLFIGGGEMSEGTKVWSTPLGGAARGGPAPPYGVASPWLPSESPLDSVSCREK
jgi:hypothetical protein